MRNSLVDALLSKGLICVDTIVTARIGTKNRLGSIRYTVSDYTVAGSTQETGSWNLTLRSVIGRTEIAASCDDIVAIDGMSIDRFADVYNINSDGSDKKVGKKRGRKPKNAAS